LALKLELNLLEERFALARLTASADAAPALREDGFAALIRSRLGVTLCCREGAAPAGAEVQNGFCCLEVSGPFDLASVGVVAAISGPLAAKDISVFLFSTWETDYLVMQAHDLAAGIAALEAAGHVVRAAP